jgi:hypothetical protein
MDKKDCKRNEAGVCEKVIIEIELGNAAFEKNPEIEVARILQDQAKKIERQGIFEKTILMDVNGNSVGSIRLIK